MPPQQPPDISATPAFPHRILVLSVAFVVVVAAIAASVYLGLFQKQTTTVSPPPKNDPFVSLPLINAYTQSNFGFSFKESSSEYPSLSLVCDEKAPKGPTETTIGQYTYCQNDGRPLKISLAWKEVSMQIDDYLKRIANTVMKNNKEGTGNFTCVSDKTFVTQNALSGVLSDCEVTTSNGSVYYFSAFFFSPSLRPEISQVVYAYSGLGKASLNETITKGMVRSLAKELLFESTETVSNAASATLLLGLFDTQVAHAQDGGGSCSGDDGAPGCGGDAGSSDATGDSGGAGITGTPSVTPPSCIVYPTNPSVGDTVRWKLDLSWADSEGYTVLAYLVFLHYTVTHVAFFESDAGIDTNYWSSNAWWNTSWDSGSWRPTGGWPPPPPPIAQIQTSATRVYSSPGTKYAVLVGAFGSTQAYAQICSVYVNPSTACSSPPNSCGQTNAGVLKNGVCSALTPSSSGKWVYNYIGYGPGCTGYNLNWDLEGTSCTVGDPGPFTNNCYYNISYDQFKPVCTLVSGNRYAEVTIPPESDCLPNADLTAGAVSPTFAAAGTATTFSAVISNRGDASTGKGFSNFFQISTLPNGGGTITDLTPSTMNTLVAGGNDTATSPAYTFSLGATPSVRVCADKSSAASTGVITESNENNNCGPWTPITVSAAVPTVMLQFQ